MDDCREDCWIAVSDCDVEDKYPENMRYAVYQKYNIYVLWGERNIHVLCSERNIHFLRVKVVGGYAPVLLINILICFNLCETLCWSKIMYY